MARTLASLCLTLAACGGNPPPLVPRDQIHSVDILFAIDNSPSVSPKQAELKARFPELIKILEAFGQANPVHYHIGVVDSDLGAGRFTLGGGQCRPDGDGGKLQALGGAHDASCLPPTNGLNFVDFNQISKDADGNPTTNLPPGQDLATTFGCMASVGDRGCGFEHVLESVYRALHDPPPENQGFLRPDALLVVLWLTDEDDCSADPNTDLFDPNATQYGPLLSFRCSQYGVACGHPPMLLPYGNSGGPLMDCHAATAAEGGKLFEASRYIDFFTKPASQGGIKDDPRNVILAAISAPPTDVETLVANSNPQPPGPFAPCPGPPDGKTCAVVLQHSCIAQQNTQFFGDPAVRLNQVVGAAKQSQLTSICDTSYQAALQSLGVLIVSNVSTSCIGPFANPAKPECVVEEVTTHPDSSPSVAEIPPCSTVGDAAPCWRLADSPACDPMNPIAGCCPSVCAKAGDPGQHFSLEIRHDGPLPENVTQRYACRTLDVPHDLAGNLPICTPIP